MNKLVWPLAAVVVGCGTGGTVATTPGSSGSNQPPPTPMPTEPGSPSPQGLPEPALALAADKLAGDHACGPFSTKEFTADVALLADRFRVRFVAKPTIEGSDDSMRAAVERNGVTLFVGARELYMYGDRNFARHATANASFGGSYDPVTIVGRDGKLSVVAGLLKQPPPHSDLVAVAHGWFVNAANDVLDVAVFASHVDTANLAECRLLASTVIATVGAGSRSLAPPAPQPVDTKVSYATFRYTLPAGWLLAHSEGIHDFARMTFRHRGSYPDGFTELQLGLDSHPGDWKIDGRDSGQRAGALFGIPVAWNLVANGSIAGAWTVSTATVKRDHAVAAIVSGTAAGRDAAIQFAESITVK